VYAGSIPAQASSGFFTIFNGLARQILAVLATEFARRV
jgi:hypothetical protein